MIELSKQNTSLEEEALSLEQRLGEAEDKVGSGRQADGRGRPDTSGLLLPPRLFLTRVAACLAPAAALLAQRCCTHA